MQRNFKFNSPVIQQFHKRFGYKYIYIYTHTHTCICTYIKTYTGVFNKSFKLISEQHITAYRLSTSGCDSAWVEQSLNS